MQVILKGGVRQRLVDEDLHSSEITNGCFAQLSVHYVLVEGVEQRRRSGVEGRPKKLHSAAMYH